MKFKLVTHNKNTIDSTINIFPTIAIMVQYVEQSIRHFIHI